MNISKQRLQAFKNVATWAGLIVTLCGIVLSIASGGSLGSGSLSLFGLLMTCCGQLISNALAKHQALDRAADKARFDELQLRFENTQSEMESMSEFLSIAGVLDRPESLRRIIREQDSMYEIIHQDDGK